MANGKLTISAEAKEMVDRIMGTLEINQRPVVIKLAIAKGIAMSTGAEPPNSYNTSKGWSFDLSIIKEQELLLFKHLIINEQQRSITSEELDHYIEFYVEKGIRELVRIEEEKNSLEDYRLAIL